jgi:hypothetical protein
MTGLILVKTAATSQAQPAGVARGDLLTDNGEIVGQIILQCQPVGRDLFRAFYTAQAFIQGYAFSKRRIVYTFPVGQTFIDRAPIATPINPLEGVPISFSASSGAVVNVVGRLLAENAAMTAVTYSGY